MAYNVDWVGTVAECDLLIAHVDDEISDMQVRIVNLQQRQKTLSEVTVEVNSEYDANQFQLDSLNSVIPTQPEGKAKRENIKEQKRLEYRQTLLGNRRESYSNVARLENQLEVKRCQAEMAEMTTFRTELQTRKDALAA